MVSLTAEATGVDFINPLLTDHPMRHRYFSGVSCGGVAIGDVDQDGLVDLFFTNGPTKNRLFRNLGDLKFEDVTDGTGITDSGKWSTGPAMVDIDGDGDLDIYVCAYDAPNELWINDGKGQFTERATEFGLAVQSASLAPYFVDIDADGRLDLFLLTNGFYSPTGLPADFEYHIEDGVPILKGEASKFYKIGMKGEGAALFRLGQPDLLFHNTGDGKFTDITSTSGIAGDGNGLSASWFDYDSDGDLDVYIANDFKDPDRFYRNDGGGKFTDVVRETMPYTAWFAMGSTTSDFNNDGRLDLFAVDMSATTHYMDKLGMGSMTDNAWFLDTALPRQYMRNVLQINTGTGRFMEIAQMAGVASSDWSWAPVAADFDADGWTDLFVTNGAARNFMNSDVTADVGQPAGVSDWDLFAESVTRPENNVAFRNLGGWEFENLSEEWGLDTLGMSFSAATGDLDGDGDLDLVTCNLDAPVAIYRNDMARGGSAIVALDAGGTNRNGIGATLTLTSESGQQSKVLMPQTGFIGGHEAIAHFGFGESEQAAQLEILWPDGSRTQHDDIVPGYRYTFVLDDLATSPAPPQSPTAPLFTVEAAPLPRHAEQPYDDFAIQPLLPNKLSQLGPGVAIGDLNGDGMDDFCVSSAIGQKSAVALLAPRKVRAQELAGSLDYEDMAPLIFDSDGDGDQDLVVVSGSNQTDALTDRLYLNDGTGRLSLAPEGTLPPSSESGSCAAAVDFDRDGDLDLFIGTRVSPGAYPTSGPSRLLRNEGGRFTDATQALCPELANAGMVTSGLWSDANGDGWPDLLLTIEWGPVRLYLNQGGEKLEEATDSAGLSKRLGWWNGIVGGDFDNDGDIDYAVTNFGTNIKYHVSEKKPAKIYYGSFEEDTSPRIIEAKVAEGTLLPVRGKSCSTHAIPGLSDRFPKFHDFAAATLEEIYTEEKLEGATLFEANELRSGVYLNKGDAEFEFAPLPDFAQTAPSFGIVSTDVDADGDADLVIAQNFYTPQRETGRMSAGLSAVLLGDGTGKFEALHPTESGLVIWEDGKGLAVTDINLDSRPDLIMGINDGTAKMLLNRSKAGAPLSVKLKSKTGNYNAVGAKVMLVREDGRTQTAEVSAGGGYLSQSSATLFFGDVPDRGAKLVVRWPDGSESTQAVDLAGGNSISIRQP